MICIFCFAKAKKDALSIPKCQSIDSTFIEDINGCKEASYDGIHKKRKGELSKGIKITTIVTNNGIPLSVNIDSVVRNLLQSKIAFGN